MEEFPEKQEEKEYKDIEALKKEYADLLAAYEAEFRELKKLDKQIIPGAGDEELARQIIFVDKERNKIHRKLKEVGAELGRKEVDVMADILREHGSLAEYGLPEFFVILGEDLSAEGFNLTKDLKRPKERFPEKGVTDPQLSEEFDWQSDIVIPFVVIPRFQYNPYSSMPLAPKDIAIRELRAMALAKEAKLKTIDGADDRWHAANVEIFGVVVPANRIEEVAGIIRNSPEKFRVGEEFYSAEDKKKIDKTYHKMIVDSLSRPGISSQEYWEARKQWYGEDPIPEKKQ